MAKLEIFLFGAVQVRRDDRVLTGLGRGKVLALLVYLVTRSGNPSDRDALASLLWPETPTERARHSLRQALVTLREIFECRGEGGVPAHLRPLLVTDEWLDFRHDGHVSSGRTDRTEPGDIGLDGTWSDVREFSSLLDACDGHAHRRLEACPSCARRMERAIELYRGDFCAWFSLADNAEFEEWTIVQREHFRRRAVDALMGLAGFYRLNGSLDQADRVIRHWLDLDPWSEVALRQLMETLWEQGDRTGALLHFERYRDALAEQLDLEPEPESVRLFARIREGQPVPPAPRESRNRYLLPDLPAPLLGRAGELNRIADLLAMSECRLLTLSGLGGVGKTSLAIEAAHELESQFAQGVGFVTFGSPLAPALIVPTIGQALGVEFSDGGAIEPEKRLIDWLHPREILLVLDNLEQAPGVGGLVARVLRQTTNVRVLATSRTRLDIAAEWVFDVGGLVIPSPRAAENVDDLFAHAPACQLFLRGAQRYSPQMELTTDDRRHAVSICRSVEGLPLAIELAAALVPVLSLPEIAAELAQDTRILETPVWKGNSPHEGMRAVFDRSWNALGADEQAVFRRLSVFRGGFLRSAAEQVAGATLPTLSVLVQSSFLRHDARGRFGMHGLLRQYGEHLLQEEPSDQHLTQARHASYFLHFLQQRENALMGRHQDRALGELSAELENIRTAWRWAIAAGEIETYSAAMQAMWLFYVERGWIEEGQIKFGQVVEALDTADATEGRVPVQRLALARALVRQAGPCFRLGRYAEALALLERRIDSLRAFDAREDLALGLNLLAATIHLTGSIAEERDLLRESLDLFRGCNSVWGLAYSLNDLGMASHMLGDRDEGLRACQESRSLFRSLGDRRGLAFVANNLGVFAAERGDWKEAESLVRESCSLRRGSDDRWGIAVSLTQLGRILVASGRREDAASCLREALQLTIDGAFFPAMLEVLMEWASLRQAEGNPNGALVIVASILGHSAVNARIQDRAVHLQTAIATSSDGWTPDEGLDLDSLTTMLLADVDPPAW